MKTLYTLDEAMSSNDILFLERASSQMIAANIAADDPSSARGGTMTYSGPGPMRLFLQTCANIVDEAVQLTVIRGEAGELLSVFECGTDISGIAAECDEGR